DLSRSIGVPRTAANGASSSLPCVLAIVCFLNQRPTLRVAGGNRSSCPEAAIHQPAYDPPSRVDCRPLSIKSPVAPKNTYAPVCGMTIKPSPLVTAADRELPSPWAGEAADSSGSPAPTGR